MERIRQKIQEIEWENDLVVTISGGVIEVVGSDELNGLLKKVDPYYIDLNIKAKT
jgi:PleD family two-component response regulator